METYETLNLSCKNNFLVQGQVFVVPKTTGSEVTEELKQEDFKNSV